MSSDVFIFEVVAFVAETANNEKFGKNGVTIVIELVDVVKLFVSDFSVDTFVCKGCTFKGVSVALGGDKIVVDVILNSGLSALFSILSSVLLVEELFVNCNPFSI